MNEIFLKNEKETIEFGKKFSKKLNENSIILLEGELGTGKTTFVKGLGKGIGIKKNIIRSPSFLIIHNYSSLIHIDLYRMQNANYQELEEAGVLEALNLNKIRVVEWPNSLIKKICPNFILIKFFFKGSGRYVRWED